MTLEQIHKISPERARLQELESTGQYVFHGSGHKLNSLEPRQAFHHPTDKEKIPDGEPAVFASPKADIAIFMSIMNSENASTGFRAGYCGNNESLEFRTTQETIDQIHSAKGYVYVFNKSDFTPKENNSLEFISHTQVQPIEVIEVTENDLPQNIEIKNF